MNSLKISNNYSYFKTSDQKVLEVLWQALRFKELNYYHSRLYKQKKWDGYRDFFSLKTGRFLTGLLPEVRLVLKELGIDYETNDTRKPFEFTTEQITKDLLNYGSKPVELYDYQVDLINQALTYKRGIIQSPTGCHRIGQKVFMYNRSFKCVEDIVVGDQLMGPDNTPRTVLNLCRGVGQMYKIIPRRGKMAVGKSFVVNEDHILTLVTHYTKAYGEKYPGKKLGEIVDISVKDLLNLPKHEQHFLKLFRISTQRSSKTRFAINPEWNFCGNPRQFDVKKLEHEPYYGFILDGDQRYLLDDFTVTHNSGKTNILIGILKCLPKNLPTLVLCKSKQLVEQNYYEINQWGLPAGRYYGERHEPNIITCSTVQSLHNLEEILPKIKCLLVDEVHDGMSAQFIDAYRQLTEASSKFAISATPFKFGGKDKVQMYRVKGWFGGIFKTGATPEKVLKTKFLQDQKKLSESICTFFPIDKPAIPYAIYLDAITQGIAESKYLREVVVSLVKKIKGRTLILVERTAHGDILNEMIPDSIWIQGKDHVEKIRKPVIEKLKSQKGDLVVIATKQILNTGINVMVHNIINCASGKADHEIIQRIGRGLRNADDKEILNYYDFLFTNNPYLEKHSKYRIEILKKEGHNVIIKESVDFTNETI